MSSELTHYFSARWDDLKNPNLKTHKVSGFKPHRRLLPREAASL